MSSKIIIWAHCTDHIINENKLVGGISIQLHLWAKTFFNRGWESFCLTSNRKYKNKNIDGIKHLYIPNTKHGTTVLSALCAFFIFLRHRPKVVISRGRLTSAYYLSLYSKIFRFKYILMIASDSNVDKFNEAKDDLQTRLFRKGITQTSYFVVQNDKQKKLLFEKYGKKQSIIIPNIWQANTELKKIIEKKDGILWVSNIRAIKQPEWFLNIAEKIAHIKFFMIGGASDKQIYNHCKERANNIPNLEFLGKKTFDETNTFFSQVKLVICTSKYEGFPNTFLQAWANNVPVITTFDPSNIVQKHKLGAVCKTVDEFVDSINNFTSNDDFYKEIKNNIVQYFSEAHNSDFQYNRLNQEFNLSKIK